MSPPFSFLLFKIFIGVIRKRKQNFISYFVMFSFKFGVGALISCISLLSSLLSFPLLFYFKERRFTRSVFLTPLKTPHLRLHFWSHKKKKLNEIIKKKTKKTTDKKVPFSRPPFKGKCQHAEWSHNHLLVASPSLWGFGCRHRFFFFFFLTCHCQIASRLLAFIILV